MSSRDKSLLIGQGKTYPELEDEKWFVKLMFLVDIITHLNEFNLCLHAEYRTNSDVSF